MTQSFDATREDLGNGLTRRRPKPGEVDWPPSMAWIYEMATHMSVAVDAVMAAHSMGEEYVRLKFSSQLHILADKLADKPESLDT